MLCYRIGSVRQVLTRTNDYLKFGKVLSNFSKFICVRNWRQFFSVNSFLRSFVHFENRNALLFNAGSRADCQINF